MALTDKQQRFVKEYLVDLNATQAAIRAGYSQKTAGSIGEENLRKPEIAAAIQEAMEARSRRTEITADRVLQELAKIGFADIRKAVKWGATVMVPCSPEVADVFIRTDGSEADFPEDDIDEELEGQAHGGALKRNRRIAPTGTIALRAHTDIALVPSDEIDDDTAAAISEVRQTKEGLAIKMHDKKGALVDIGRHLGMFKDKLELSGGLTKAEELSDDELAALAAGRSKGAAAP